MRNDGTTSRFPIQTDNQASEGIWICVWSASRRKPWNLVQFANRLLYHCTQSFRRYAWRNAESHSQRSRYWSKWISKELKSWNPVSQGSPKWKREIRPCLWTFLSNLCWPWELTKKVSQKPLLNPIQQSRKWYAFHMRLYSQNSTKTRLMLNELPRSRAARYQNEFLSY